MSALLDDAFLEAHRLLADRVGPRASRPGSGRDPEDPAAVQAMQLVLEVPREGGASRSEMLRDAAQAAVAVCLDERAGRDGFWRGRLEAWYSLRIRKVARRARNKAWDDVQALPGVTVGSVRAFVPSAVGDVPREIRKLQIKGTELSSGDGPAPLDPGAPTLVVNADLEMSAGKAAAQVGHASMLYAAALGAEEARAWAAAGFPLNVREVGAAEFGLYAAEAGAVPVRDAGFTEVAPGSVTVVAVPPGV